MRRWLSLSTALLLSACASLSPVAPPLDAADSGWTAAAASTRTVGLGLRGGAQLADGVRFAGGVELVADETSPLHSLSDFKLTTDGFISVSDAGDLVRGRLRFGHDGRLVGMDALAFRRLTLSTGDPIVEKVDGDAEGLLITEGGDLLVSFERNHRIWNYGDPDRPAASPRGVASPDHAFALNDGMEGVSVRAGGWRVTGESGGVWDCGPAGCAVVTAPPETPLADSEYRITGMDRDPDGGFFVVQRSYAPPIDARARVRRMDASGVLGPVLIELKLPSTTDNFEGIAVERRGGQSRLYILSDDNNNAAQRTLLLAFDVRSAR
ncbi:esterase-like activity of phytase family protein [Brevundimonas sp. NPDC092305]|uniref:esterase-like activity of phytase family protein n=1 Tax=Brevundimonas sp. NPDC092305 TaxID=3363957 RepID=UPI00380DCC46